MHSEILSDKQKGLIPLIRAFSKDFFLVGGTAVALHIGHRRSIDFDLFTIQNIKRGNIRNRIEKEGFAIEGVLYEAFDQLHVLVNTVKITFFNYPYSVPHPVDFDGVIKIPELLDLGAMKTYALGGRAKWKDYVDMYYILKDYYDLKAISSRARQMFGTAFNEKLFREQLCYFDDIDYSEKVDYLAEDPGNEIIKLFLCEVATTPFS